MNPNRFDLRALLISFFFAFFFIGKSYGQCYVSILNTASDTMNIPCGTSVQLERDLAGGNYPVFDMFNTGVAGPFWETTSSPTFSNICGPKNSIYLWMGGLADVPRTLETIPLDLPCGAEVCFEFRFAVQGDPSPCEGPDLPDEGVMLEFSTDGGLNWDSIFYFEPNTTGSFNSLSPGSGDYTAWGNYCFNLPSAASVNNVKLRWIQSASSTAPFDHWGMDSITVRSLCLGGPTIWSTGDTGQFITTPNLQTPTLYWVRRIVGSIAPDTCFDTLVVQPGPYEVNLNQTSSITCFGENQGAISASVSGGTNQQQFLWSNGATGNAINSLTAGVYSITATDSAGCIAVDSMELTQPDSLYAALTIEHTTCDSTTDGKIVATGIGGTPVYLFYWDGVVQTSGFADSLEQLGTGSYELRIVDINNCESIIQSQVATDNPRPLASLNDTTLLCEGSNVMLDAGNAGASFNWSTGETSQLIDVSTSGIYTVTVSALEGCGSIIDSTFVKAEPCLGVTELFSEQIDIYPNPLTDKLNIRLKTVGSNLSKVTLYSKHGKLMLDRSVNSDTEITLDMSHLARGIYFLELQSETGQVYREKVIKI